MPDNEFNYLLGAKEITKMMHDLAERNEKANAKKAAENKRLSQITQRSIERYGYPTDVVGVQEELYKQGYFGPGVSYEKAINGIWGKRTEDAFNRRKLDEKYKEKEDNSLFGKAERAMAAPVVKMLNNMFPYGYTNTKDVEKAKEAINLSLIHI